MWFSFLSHNHQSSMSGEPRRARGSARRWGACWPAVAALGLLGGFATPDTHAVTTATFGNPISTAVPQALVAMVTADINGDGKPDRVAASNSPLVGVYVMLSQGNGTFNSPTFWWSGTSPILALAVGDVDSDGKLDIVAAGYYDGNVNVLLNNGAGTFGAAWSYAVAGTPNSIALGDFNADGTLDIVATNGTELDLLLNNGDGTFGAAQAVGPAGISVVVADFNNDGLPDLAQIDGSGTSVDVVLNTSTPPSGGKGKGHK